MTKFCTRCGKKKPLSHFRMRKARCKPGFRFIQWKAQPQSWCRECERAYLRAYYRNVLKFRMWQRIKAA